MKTFFKFFLSITFIVFLSSTVHAKTTDEYPFPLIIVDDPNANDNRSPELTPFHAQVWDTYVMLSCASSIGNANVTITSTAGDDYETVFNTAFGSIIIPISGNPGLYRLDIELPAGQSYYGQFVL